MKRKTMEEIDGECRSRAMMAEDWCQFQLEADRKWVADRLIVTIDQWDLEPPIIWYNLNITEKEYKQHKGE